MVDLDALIEKFHDNHEVEYILAVKVDGEVLFKETSSISFDDVTMAEEKLSDAMTNHIIQDENDRLEYIRDAEAEDQMARMAEERSE